MAGARPATCIAARAGFRLIQAERVESRTASLADQWLRIRPGSEDGPGAGAGRPRTKRRRRGRSATGLTEAEIAALAAALVWIAERTECWCWALHASPAAWAIRSSRGAKRRCPTNGKRPRR